MAIPKKSKAQEALNEAAGLSSNLDTSIRAFVRPARGAPFEGYDFMPMLPLQQSFRGAAIDFAADLRERVLVPYTPGRKPDDHELPYLSANDVEGLEPVIASAAANQLLELFDPASDTAKHLRLLVVSLESPNPGTVHFGQHASIQSRLSRSKIGVFFTGSAFDKVEDDVLLFRSDFDFVVVNDILLMANQIATERVLGFLEQAGTAAIATMRTITSNLRIGNTQGLLDAAGNDSNMISKIRGIQAKMDRNASYAASMIMTKVVPFIQQHPELEIVLQGPAGQEEIVFSPEPTQRWKILKLLDDDYLHSELTGSQYEANSKSLR